MRTYNHVLLAVPQNEQVLIERIKKTARARSGVIPQTVSSTITRLIAAKVVEQIPGTTPRSTLYRRLIDDEAAREYRLPGGLFKREKEVAADTPAPRRRRRKRRVTATPEDRAVALLGNIERDFKELVDVVLDISGKAKAVRTALRAAGEAL